MKTFSQYLQEQVPNQAQQAQQVKPGTQPNQAQQVKPGTQPNQAQQVKPGTQPNQAQQPKVDIKKLTDTFNALKQLLGPLGIK
jgi:hypothetical protein